jgi:hypothetical protein
MGTDLFSALSLMKRIMSDRENISVPLCCPHLFLKNRREGDRVHSLPLQGQEGRAISRDVDFTQKTSRQYLVRVKTGSDEYEGLLYSPYPDMRLSDVISRIEGFLNLKDARDVSSDEKYPFMVVNKTFIETIKVIDER